MISSLIFIFALITVAYLSLGGFFYALGRGGLGLEWIFIWPIMLLFNFLKMAITGDRA